MGQYQVVESPGVPQNSTAISPRKPLHSDLIVDTRLSSLEPRLSWFYIRLLLLTGISYAIQATILSLLVFTRVLVANDIGMGARVLEIFAASIFMGSMVGGPIFGHIADRFGRRTALVVAMVFSLGGLAVSARANAGNILIIGRVVTGLGLGGQLSSTVVLVQEVAPRSMRGRVTSLLDAFTGMGGLAGLALAFAVAPRLGWRTTYLVVCGLVLYAGVLWFTVPESPRWLASVDRMEEACAIVESIERSHCLQTPEENLQKVELNFASIMESGPSSAAKPSPFQRLITIFTLWTLWIATTLSSYALGIYAPTLISFSGFNMFASWSTIAVLNAAQVVGSLTAASVLFTYGARHSFAGFATLAAIFSTVLSYVSWSRAIVITLSFLVTASLSACWSCVLSYTPGHYATVRRCRGMGYAVGVSRLAAVGGCYLCPHMFNVWVLSVPVLCWVFGGLLVIAALGVVPRIGYQPLNQEGGIDSSAWTSGTDLEPGAKTSANNEDRSE